MFGNIPLPEDFTARPAKMDDLHDVLNVFTAYSVDQIGWAVLEETELRGDWQMPCFNLETDTQVVIAPDGQLVGYVAVWDREPHVCLYAQVRLLPTYTGQGIGTFLGRWSKARAQEAIPKAPADARVVLQQAITSTNNVAQALLRRWGYHLERHFINMAIEMDAPPPEPKVPDGITIRPFVRETEACSLVYAIRDAFRDHWGYVESSLEEDLVEWETWMDDGASFEESLWFVAADDATGEFAGFSICYDVTGECPHAGMVEQLGVRRLWRRRGLGLALLHHSFGALYRRGRTTVKLYVDAESLTGATCLYERAGMHMRYRSDRYAKVLRSGRELSTQTLES